MMKFRWFESARVDLAMDCMDEEGVLMESILVSIRRRMGFVVMI
jgi:hypothetical protein